MRGWKKTEAQIRGMRRARPAWATTAVPEVIC